MGGFHLRWHTTWGIVFALFMYTASPAHALEVGSESVWLAKRTQKMRKPRHKRRSKPQTEVVDTPVPAAASKWSYPVTPDESTASVLARASRLYEALEYDRVIPLTAAVLSRSPLSLDERLDAYLLQGKSLAIVGDPTEAEKAFRLLLRARPDFRMDADASPKILVSFRKVLAEETETQRLLEEALRKQIIANIRLSGEVSENPVGGYPLGFRYRVTDPSGSVEKVTLRYRREGGSDFASLPLVGRGDGSWAGAIPGEWTSAADGFVLEYCVVTEGETGPLSSHGTPESPIQLIIAPGTLELATPPPLPLWSFGVGAGITSVLGLMSGGLALSVVATQAAYDELAESALSEPVSGKTMMALAEQGETLMWAQFIGLGTTAFAGLGTVMMVPFTNWSGKNRSDIPPFTQVPDNIE